MMACTDRKSARQRGMGFSTGARELKALLQVGAVRMWRTMKLLFVAEQISLRQVDLLKLFVQAHPDCREFSAC